MSYRHHLEGGLSKEGATILLWILVTLFFCLVVAGCKHVEPPLKAAVVAPTGPATAAAAVAVMNEQAAAAAQAAAQAAVLSKIAASAGAITEINSGQPPGPRTDGVANEAGIIVALTGEPVSADRFAASERARIVAEGKAAEIAQAYATATSEAAQLKAQVNATQAALAAAQAALANAQQAAAAEQANLKAKYQAALDQLAKEGNERVAAAIKAGEDKARAEMNHWVTIIFFGFSALFIAGGIVILLTAVSIPMFGPKAGFAIIGAGLGLSAVGIAINQIQNFLYNHPWIVGSAVAACLIAAAVAGGMIWSNHHHAAKPATAAA